jgi:hypothetical protein
MIYYALSMGVLGSHNCHLVRIFWQIGRINLVGRLYQQNRKAIGNREEESPSLLPGWAMVNGRVLYHFTKFLI